MRTIKDKPEKPYYRTVEPSQLPDQGLTKAQRMAAADALLKGAPLSLVEILRVGKEQQKMQGKDGTK